MKKVKGFTLMELILAIGLSTLVISGLGAIFAGTITVWRKVQNSTSALKDGRLAMQWITKDIREGVITEIGYNYIKLTDAEYSLSGTNLMRGEDVLAQGVANLYLTCYNKNGAVENNINMINFVSILLTVEIGGHRLSLNNGTNLRNFVSAQ